MFRQSIVVPAGSKTAAPYPEFRSGSAAPLPLSSYTASPPLQTRTTIPNLKTLYRRWEVFTGNNRQCATGALLLMPCHLMRGRMLARPFELDPQDLGVRVIDRL